jgi:hypothetical protein
MHKLMLATSFVALAACNANPPPAAPPDTPTTRETPAAPTPAATAPTAAMGDTAATAATDAGTPAFADRVWRVTAGSGVQAGSTYAFLGDGTLLMDSPGGTPSTGSWRYADGQLTMTEEGIAYPVDIVLLQDNRFTIRSNNPGGAVTIEMSAAPDLPLPQLQ